MRIAGGEREGNQDTSRRVLIENTETVHYVWTNRRAEWIARSSVDCRGEPPRYKLSHKAGKRRRREIRDWGLGAERNVMRESGRVEKWKRTCRICRAADGWLDCAKREKGGKVGEDSQHH